MPHGEETIGIEMSEIELDRLHGMFEQRKAVRRVFFDNPPSAGLSSKTRSLTRTYDFTHPNGEGTYMVRVHQLKRTNDFEKRVPCEVYIGTTDRELYELLLDEIIDMSTQARSHLKENRMSRGMQRAT